MPFQLWNQKSEAPFDCISVVDLGSVNEKDNPLEALNQKLENVRCAVAGNILL